MDSLAQNTSSPDLVEVLIKFDLGDIPANDAEYNALNAEYPFLMKTTWGPRKRGYIDIHHGYNQLIEKVSSESKIVIAMADDFTVENGWDAKLRQSSCNKGDLFIIHQEEWPVNSNNLTVDVFNVCGDLFVIDSAPAWSTKLLEITGGFPVSFTDAWTICLEYALLNIYGIDISYFTKKKFVNRMTCEIDQPNNYRWNNERKINFDYIKSSEFQVIVAHQAKEIATRMNQLSGVK